MRLSTLTNGRAALLVGAEVLEIDAALTALDGQSDLPLQLESFLPELVTEDKALQPLRRLQDAITSGDTVASRLRQLAIMKPLTPGMLLAPLPSPRLVLCCGANYRSHIAEMGVPLPEKPVAFLKNPRAVIGPDSPIKLPRGHDKMVDWEAEFCGVIGRVCHQVSANEALDYVAGYTMIVDVSARDWATQFAKLPAMDAIGAWDENLLGKQFETFCPMGPAIATKDEIPDIAAATFSLKVNGATKQSACNDDWIFSLAALIAHYSQWYTFYPGDVISTGSPPGVGFGAKPPQFLQPGDIMTVEANGIGSMNIPVAASTKD
jgi:acylpyruvate hydrolase